MIYVVNPRQGKRKGKGKARKSYARRKPGTAVAVAAKKSPRRRASRGAVKVAARRYKRNPRFGGNIVANIKGSLMPAAIGAGGALASDVLLGLALAKLPVPEMLKTGPARHALRGASAIVTGTLAGFLVKPEMARQIMQGGLTVALHAALREGVTKVAPQVPLADLEDDIGRLEQDLGTLLADERAMGSLAVATQQAERADQYV